MKIFEPFIKAFCKFAVGVVKAWVYISYRPKLYFEDREVQTNRMKAPCVIIANHNSIKDPLMLLAIIKGKKDLIVAKDWYDMPKFHWLLSREQCIPCDRYSMDTEWLFMAKKELAAGKSIIIFPEGRCRLDGGEPYEFKSGFAFLARTANVPVVSIGHEGVYKFGRRIKVVVGTPEKIVRNKGVPSSQDLADQSAKFRERVIDLKAKAKEYK